MIANLRYAARNNEKVWIGGGEFSGRELTEVADALEAKAVMHKALIAIRNVLDGNPNRNVGNSTVHYAYIQALNALAQTEGK